MSSVSEYSHLLDWKDIAMLTNRLSEEIGDRAVCQVSVFFVIVYSSA
jgi:galactitol-specific phosphotransferase system IIB component